MTAVYVIGSLRNPVVPKVAGAIRGVGLEAYDDWYAAGPNADDHWREYELSKGHTYEDALNGYSAEQVFRYDREHLQRCDAAVLVLPAGRSGHLELGYAAGLGKHTYIFLDQDYDRWDVMYKFAGLVTSDLNLILDNLKAI